MKKIFAFLILMLPLFCFADEYIERVIVTDDAVITMKQSVPESKQYKTNSIPLDDKEEIEDLKDALGMEEGSALQGFLVWLTLESQSPVENGLKNLLVILTYFLGLILIICGIILIPLVLSFSILALPFGLVIGFLGQISIYLAIFASIVGAYLMYMPFKCGKCNATGREQT